MARKVIGGIDNQGQRLRSLAAPVQSDDAANKAYADGLVRFKLLSTSGDLAAAAVASLTFGGLNLFTDLLFELNNTGHDNASAQTLAFAVSTDGSNFSSAVAFTPSISSGSSVHGSCLMIGNGLRRNVMRCGFTTGNPIEPSIPTATEAPRALVLAGAIVAIRFTPTTAGNLNKGTINAYVR